jgi:hypothetical protein
VLRGCALALLALIAPGVASDAAQGAEPGAPQIEQVAPIALGRDAVALPNGAVFDVGLRWDEGRDTYYMEAAQLRADGAIARTELGVNVALRAGPQPLTDGTTAVVAENDGRAVLLRLGADGAVVGGETVMPVGNSRQAGFALDADGTVWIAQACDDRLLRRSPDGVVRRYALPRRGCGRQPNDDATGVAVGADGAVWVVNMCAGRVVRRDPSGRMRQWLLRGVSCSYWGTETTYTGRATVIPDPRGGIAWTTTYRSAYKRQGAFGGRVLPDGRALAKTPTGWDGFFDAGGGYWFVDQRVAPDGTTATDLGLPDGRLASALAPARGGGAWLVGARTTYVSEYKQSYWWYDDPVASLIRPDGSAQTWPLPALNGSPTTYASLTGALLAGDGSLWVGYAAGDRNGGNRTYRITPPGLPAATAATAVVTRISGRAGRSLTVQLRCEADASRWCRGTVRLAGVAKPVPYLVAGQQRAGVRLTLGDRAAARLRRGWIVRTRAVTTAEGAAGATTDLVLRR